MQNNNPLSPHLQIYKWHISSLLSITHRVVGVINFFALMVICYWVISLFFGENFYRSFEIVLNTFFGKFLIISLCWTFSFQILNEIRHLVWDAGFGFDLKAAKIVADHIGTVHHEINFTVQEGVDAIGDVIYHLETYYITTIIASTTMYLMAISIKLFKANW